MGHPGAAHDQTQRRSQKDVEFDEEDPEVAAASAQGGYANDESDNEGFVSLDAVKKHYRGDDDEDEESDDGLDITEKLRKEIRRLCVYLYSGSYCIKVRPAALSGMCSYVEIT